MKNLITLALTFITVIAICQVPPLDIDGVAGQPGIRVTGGQDGLQILSPTADAISINGASNIGINMLGVAGNGIQVIQTGGDGLYIYDTGHHGIRMDNLSENGIMVTDAGWHAGYFVNNATSIFPALHIQAGNDANMDMKFSGHARIVSQGSFVYYLDENDNSSSDRMVVVNSAIEDVFEINESGNAIIHNKLSIPTASGIALEIQSAGNDGILINNSFDSGINVFGAGGHGGYFNTATSSPNAAIEVSSGDDTKMDIRMNGHGRVASGGDVAVYLDDNDNGTNEFVIHRSATGPLGTKVFTANENGQVSVLYKIAVGPLSTTPIGYVFSVDGKMIAEEVVVQLTQDWPDYVFNQSYDRMELNELADYIDQNKHLPNIPSAAEIASDGLTIGEMQRLHMEKIEELTLYILDLHKEIEALKKSK